MVDASAITGAVDSPGPTVRLTPTSGDALVDFRASEGHTLMESIDVPGVNAVAATGDPLPPYQSWLLEEGATPVQLGDYGPGTHLKFVSVSSYENGVVGAEGVPAQQWTAYAASNNQLADGFPDLYKGYQSATFANGDAVPGQVLGNSGHTQIQASLMEELFSRSESEDASMIASVKGLFTPEGALANPGNVVVRAGGLTVGEDGAYTIQTTSAVNRLLSAQSPNDPAVLADPTGRALPAPEAEVLRQTIESHIEAPAPRVTSPAVDAPVAAPAVEPPVVAPRPQLQFGGSVPPVVGMGLRLLGPLGILGMYLQFHQMMNAPPYVPEA
jgi:hypothetical protein